jgi:hypothetical protein
MLAERAEYGKLPLPASFVFAATYGASRSIDPDMKVFYC